jgi:hypothetical protein
LTARTRTCLAGAIVVLGAIEIAQMGRMKKTDAGVPILAVTLWSPRYHDDQLRKAGGAAYACRRARSG